MSRAMKRAASGGRRVGQRVEHDRLVHHRLHRVDDDRLAFDVEHAFHAQQIRAAQAGEHVEPHHEARARGSAARDRGRTRGCARRGG